MFARFTLSLCLAAALLSSPVHAASDGKYQFTGVVTSIDGDMLTVKKNEKETWTFFATPGQVTAKVGDKITVHYKMDVVSIEAKPAKKGK